MIISLYNFSIGSYVVAEEWNANFRVLSEYCFAHAEAIEDGYDIYAFPDSDLTNIFDVCRSYPNVKMNQAYTSFMVERNTEFYIGSPENPNALPAQQQVRIVIPQGLEGEARVIFRLPELMTVTPPILIEYKGVVVTPGDKTADCYVNVGDYSYYNPGTYYVMIHEQNGKAQVKLISTGV